MATRTGDIVHRHIARIPDGLISQSIANDICRRIQSGEWGVGAKLPGRNMLSKEYTAGMNTIQQAINRLVAVGLLASARRSGTYVARAVEVTDFSATHEPATVIASTLPKLSHAGSITHSAPLVAGIVMIGGYVPEDAQSSTSNYWGNGIARAFERSFSRMGGRAYVISEANWLETGDIFSYFHQKNVNILIVVDNYGLLVRYPLLHSNLETSDIPVILISADEIATDLPMVTYDQQHAGYLAAKHLIQCGYQAIRFLRPFTAVWAEERLKGIRAALTRYQVGPEAFQVYPATTLYDDTAYYQSMASVTQAGGSLFDDATFTQGFRAALASEVPCAIIAPNDEHARMVMQCMQQEGLTPGVDYGLIGFDDEVYAQGCGLTTLRPPLEAMGEMAAQLAESLVRHDVIEYQIKMRSHLIVRASTRPMFP